MDGKRMRRKEKAMETRARIQRCALELFERNGYDNVSMREIAEAAHASIGSIYHHLRARRRSPPRSRSFWTRPAARFTRNLNGGSRRREPGRPVC